MNSEKIIYWVALAAFTLGMSHEYHAGKFPAAHRMLLSAESAVCPLVGRAERTLALARFIIHPPDAEPNDFFAASTGFAQDQAELLRDQARDQAELVREQVQAQAEMWRARAELQQAQIEQVRHMAGSEFRFSHAADRHIVLTCPKTGAKIAVKVDAPSVEVSDNF